jgi:diguanylate cyclase (GGDEF)-like protein/putative nucleotidyltransferase with HDIG domain/PAS domain S-box-containing protein
MRALHLQTVRTLESITDAIFALDAEWNATYVNRQAEVLLETRRKELIGKSVWQIFPGGEEAAFGQQFRRAAAERVTVLFEVLHAPLNRWFEVTAYPAGAGLSVHFRDTTERRKAAHELQTVNGQLERQILRVNEQAAELESQKVELKEANSRLTALSVTDGLTGLYNHRALQERLARECERTQRYKAPLSLILLDVDKFKTYNDTFGHPEGDVVLKAVAQMLQECARETDTVCRYGGDEFVIILPDTETQGAVEAAERLRVAIEAYPWPLRPVTGSFGATTLHAGLTSAQELIAQADRALYAGKARGRNRVAHYAEISVTESLDALKGNASLPLSDILREILHVQQETLASASEQVREVLAQAFDATILSWSRLLDMKDKETEGHSSRVTKQMTELARRVGMNEEEVLYARWGALLHDVGKMGVPDTILHKPGTLDEAEREVMRRHTTASYEMLRPVMFLRPALDIPYCHHERWDGAGYPRGLKGDEIPLAARLFAVVDVFDALTSDRPYCKAWPREKTIDHLRSLAGTHFDPRAVEVFLQMEAGLTSTAQAPDAIAEAA